MTKRQLAIITSVVMAFCVGCTGKGNTPSGEEEKARNDIPIDTALRSRLEDFGSKPRPDGKFAFHVYDITADKPVYGVNDSLALPSASCMKLLSGIAGLHLLGCDYHYWTAIFLRGNVASDGTLKGDLAFKAGLDPQLLAPDLGEFAKVVRKKGVKRVGGKVYVDLTINEPVKSEEHWYPWDLTFSKYGLFYKGSDKVVKALKASLRGNGIAVADSQIVFKPTT
ncbi:MAG: D-alanyl-D-alanine carboxypeptidase, partial [Prevotellaceae bacterium]|nr:D-alanyl-D-alanine carboxypeptidase [Prevotellaceae bacterium]